MIVLENNNTVYLANLIRYINVGVRSICWRASCGEAAIFFARGQRRTLEINPNEQETNNCRIPRAPTPPVSLSHKHSGRHCDRRSSVHVDCRDAQWPAICDARYPVKILRAICISRAGSARRSCCHPMFMESNCAPSLGRIVSGRVCALHMENYVFSIGGVRHTFKYKSMACHHIRVPVDADDNSNILRPAFLHILLKCDISCI